MALITLGLGVLAYQILITYDNLHEVAPQKFTIEKATTTLIIAVLFVSLLAAVGGFILARAIVLPLRTMGSRLEEFASTGRIASVSQPMARVPEIDILGQRFNQVLGALNTYVTQRNRYILECFTGGLVLLDPEGAIMTMNSSAEAMIGPESQSLTGKNFERWLRSVDPDSALARIIHDAMGEGVFADSKEIELTAPSMGRFPIIATINLLQSPQGERTGYSINFRDLRAYKEFYQQMQRADQLAALGTFATGIAHEIRNPLGTIKGMAQLLAEEQKPDAGARRFLNVIVREVNRLDRVVRSVMDFARPAAAPPEPADLNRIVMEAVNLTKDSMESGAGAGVHISTQLGDIPPIFSQPEQLVQAFINIIRNAIEAAAPSGKVKIVTQLCTDGKEGRFCETRVTNTGETIPPDDIFHIFEPFFSRKEGGVGLGLAITSQIITSNHGHISVQSGEGLTTFFIRLPVSE
ncbi:MAG: ATP-binding protein [Candidatus Sumerlaeota bacterium]|nr:ATP-binding protein [Candidatus Sumerlaeota bacterium]